MTENTPGKKAAISQFQIKNVTDITTEPVTPVKIAPPPVTVKRAKSLKSDRTKFKRYVSVPHKNRDTFTLPRQVTDPNIKQKADNKKQEPESIEHNNNNKTSENGAETRVEQEGAVTETKETKPSNGISKMPETASWQNVVNTHRRGSSMTFVSTQNWAQFDVAPVKEKEPEFDWNITVDQWSSYEEAFHGIKPLHGFISGKQSREYLVNTGLPRESLAKIWDLADMDHDGSLSLAEFAVAMHCISCISAVSSVQLPVHVPHKLRDSLLFHVSNNLLSSINKAENNKSPEKSSLKSSGSTSKGANVTFREENSTCDTLPRQRPRPSKKLVTTTPLHLKPQPVLSSSSYYSSDNSEEESEPVSRKLDLSDMSEKKKHDKKERREKKKKHKSKSSESESKNDVDHSPNQEQAPSDTKLPIRRERTYEEVGDFITKLEIQEGDDDVEALLQSSEDEDKVPAPPPPALSPSTKTRRPSRPDMGPPRRRPSSAAPTGPPPCSPPPSSPPTSSPPPSSLILVEEKEEAEEKGEKGEEEIKEEAKENIEGAKEIKEKEVKAVKEEIEETKEEVEETKEEVEETKEEVEETKEEVEETKEEVEETKEEDEETEEEEQGSPTEVTTTSAEDGEVTSGSENSVNHDPSGYERLADELPEAELMVAPTIVLNEGEMIDSDSEESGEDDNDVTPRVDDVTPNLVTSQEDTTEKNVAEALDGHTDLPILRLEQPAMARGHRSGSVDSAMLTYCPDKDGFRLPDFKSLHEETCQNKLQLEDLEADEEELKAEKDMWNLDDVAHTEPDFEQLKETDLADLRTMIRDYELHNSALFTLARELRIELLRVQEQKHHLKSTLKCMKKD